MIEHAYHDLHDLEKKHWWYFGAREICRVFLNWFPTLHGGKIIDIGSGTGGNFSMLSEFGEVLGLEFSQIAIELSPRDTALGIISGSADKLPVASDTFDIVVMFGLIEHMQDDLKTLQEAARVCKPEGCILLLTSASPILWSHHDLANRHYRRYTRRALLELFDAAQVRPVRVSYQNFFTYLPVLVTRIWQKRRSQPPRYDMGSPIPVVNAFLKVLMRVEAFLIRYFPLPIGVDLVALVVPEAGLSNDRN